jgi:hypothetical protein
VLVQTLPAGSGAPAGVPAGTGGQAEGGVSPAALLALGGAVLPLAGGATAVARARA